MLDQVVYLRFGQFERRDSFDQWWRFREMVGERICGKRQYDFRRRQLTQDARDKCEFYLGEAGLIEKEDRAPGTRLSSTNFIENAAKFFFEPAGADNDLVIMDSMSTFGQNFSKMVRSGPR